MTTLLLKIIAVVSMIVDHIGAIFFPYYMIHIFGYPIFPLRLIGRIAFPIYCFLLVEGLWHTSNWKRYALRLGFLALLSEIPFDLALFGTITWSHQNVFFTLFLGLLAMQWDLISQKKENYFYGWLGFVAAGMAAWKLNTDYGMVGIIMIWMCYWFRNQLVVLAVGFMGIGLYMGMSQPFAVLAMIPISFYNGKQGYHSKIIQFIWYFIYPLHLAILAVFR